MEKNKVMMISIIVLLVVLLITIAGGAFLVVSKLNSAETAEKEPEPVKQENIQLVQFDTDSIYTNLRVGDDNKNHVIRVGFSLGIDVSDKKEGEAFVTTITDKTPIVKDVIIGVLRNKTSEELEKSDAQAVLREEILEKLQQEFDSNLIVNVYLSDLFID